MCVPCAQGLCWDLDEGTTCEREGWPCPDLQGAQHPMGELPGGPHPPWWPLPSAASVCPAPKLRGGRAIASLQPEGSVGEGGEKELKRVHWEKRSKGSFSFPFPLPLQLPAQPKFSRDRPWILMRPHCRELCGKKGGTEEPLGSPEMSLCTGCASFTVLWITQCMSSACPPLSWGRTSHGWM